MQSLPRQYKLINGEVVPMIQQTAAVNSKDIEQQIKTTIVLAGKEILDDKMKMITVCTRAINDRIENPNTSLEERDRLMKLLDSAAKELSDVFLATIY